MAAGGTVYYVFNKPHRNVEKEKPAYTLTATELFADFSEDEQAGYEKYGDKVIEVSGEIVEINEGEKQQLTIVLGDVLEGVSCAIADEEMQENKDKVSGLSTGDNVTLKGKCDGMDMIMGVVLTRCFIIEN